MQIEGMSINFIILFVGIFEFIWSFFEWCSSIY